MIRMTEDLARAAAQDAGNASARSHGGAPWTAEDYNVFCRAYNYFWPDSIARRIAKENGTKPNIPHSRAGAG